MLKKKNYLFVDGRYTIQAEKESGKNFNIIEIHKKLPHTIIKNLKFRVMIQRYLHLKNLRKKFFE